MDTLILLSFIIKTSQKLHYMDRVAVKIFLHIEVLIQLLLNTVLGELEWELVLYNDWAEISGHEL